MYAKFFTLEHIEQLKSIKKFQFSKKIWGKGMDLCILEDLKYHSKDNLKPLLKICFIQTGGERGEGGEGRGRVIRRNNMEQT